MEHIWILIAIAIYISWLRLFSMADIYFLPYNALRVKDFTLSLRQVFLPLGIMSYMVINTLLTILTVIINIMLGLGFSLAIILVIGNWYFKFFKLIITSIFLMDPDWSKLEIYKYNKE